MLYGTNRSQAFHQWPHSPHIVSHPLYAISVFVACTCRRHNSISALYPSSDNSMIPRTVHFRKYHIPISLPKHYPGTNTVLQKTSDFDKLTSKIYCLMKSHYVADLIPLIACEVSIESLCWEISYN